jgi:hypothetical protein
MGQEEEEVDSPAELRALAGRVRMIASVMGKSEQRRLLRYADELEAMAVSLEQRNANNSA